METTKRIFILLSLVLFIAGAVQSTEKTAAAKVSNTRFASCVVKITTNPNVFPLNYESVESLLRSSSVAGKAGRDVLGLPPEQSIEFFEIEPLSRDAAGAIPPEPQRMGDDMMMDERMMRSEQRMIEDRDMYAEMTDEPARTASRRGRSESRSARSVRGGRTGRGDIGLYGEEARRPRVIAPAPPPSPDVEQTILFRLSVELPEDVKPAAEEFMNVLIKNLRQTLNATFDTHMRRLQAELELTQTRRNKAQSQLSKIMEQARAIEPLPPIRQDPANLAVYKQLDQIVDLSMLSPTMPFNKATDILKNSVDPPLKMVVLWRDLFDNAEIEPNTKINLDGIPGIRICTALEILLKAVAGESAELGYVIKNGVITIATIESLPNSLETQVYDIPSLIHPAGEADDLVMLIQDAIEPDSWFETGIGEGTIGVYLGRKLAILQTPEIHQEIQNFLQTIKIDSPIDIPVDIPLEPLLDEKQNLLRVKQRLEMEAARLEARHAAIEEQNALMNKQIMNKVEDDPIIHELQEIVDMLSKRYSEFEKLVSESGRVSSPELEDAMKRLIQAKTELAKRRGELSRFAGGDHLARFNRELADTMIELAEKRAELGVVNKQLNQAERQLTAATTLDPQVLQIRSAQQALENAERRIRELESFLANLQEPTVTVLGAD